MIVQFIVASGEIWRRFRPRHLKRVRSSNRIPFLLRDHGEEILDPNDLRTRDICDRCFVHGNRNRACNARPNHARMCHVGKTDISTLFQCAEHLARNVTARIWLADNLELGCLLQRAWTVTWSLEATPSHSIRESK